MREPSTLRSSRAGQGSAAPLWQGSVSRASCFCLFYELVLC